MTNLKYAKLLVNKFQLKEAETLALYETALKVNSNANCSVTDAYLGEIAECHRLANQAERLMQNLLNGSISPFDQID